MIALWPKGKTTAAPAAAHHVDPADTVEPQTGRSPQAPTPSAPAGEPAPVIDEILVEKREVCQGEENLITVRAHTENGTDGLLHYTIDGARGSSVPVRLFLEPDGKVGGKHFLSVFGRGNVVTTVPLPQYTVKNCQPARYVLVNARVEANAPDTYDFSAQVMSLPAPARGIRVEGGDRPFVPASYRWSFGDDETAETDVPGVSHSYEGRPQDTYFSQMTVSVEVRSRNGDKLLGRTSLALLNPAFESRSQKGIVSLLVSLDPRFPRLDDHGQVEQHVRLRHTERQPVKIDAVTVTKYFEGGGQSEPEHGDVAALLGTRTIPQGKEGIVTTAVLDTVADPRVFSVTYNLAGTSADGLQVSGAFSVMKPPPIPTPENSKPVVDPSLKAKIIAARELLHKDIVNDEDIALLEREGKLANLDSIPASTPASAK